MTALLLSLWLSATAATTTAPTVEERDEQRARLHFERGVVFLGRKAWGEALAEFLTSRRLKPLPSNTLNAAICSQRLGRTAEAVELFEELLGSPQLQERALVERTLRELRPQLGLIELLELPAGTTIWIDGRMMGVAPLRAPLRVTAGPRRVRLFVAGAEPFEVEAMVAGGETTTLEARLLMSTRSGVLQVREASGQAAQLWIDGLQRGPIPWEGAVAVGRHVLELRGSDQEGAPPTAVTVNQSVITPVTLRLEALRCSLRVVPSPAAARVSLDRTELGRGSWEGPVRCGDHLIEASDEGFLAASRTVVLTPEEPVTSVVELDRDPSAGWGVRSGRIFAEGAAFGLLAAEMGGAPAASCSGTCSESLPWGGLVAVRAGYQFLPRVNLGVDLGWVQWASNLGPWEGGLVSVPDGGPAPGQTQVRRVVSGPAFGVAVALERGSRWIWQVGATVSVWTGQVIDERRAVEGNQSLGGLQVRAPVVGWIASPEARIGRHFGNVDVALALRPSVLVLSTTPSWRAEADLVASDGLRGYPEGALIRAFQFWVSLGIVLRLNAL